MKRKWIHVYVYFFITFFGSSYQNATPSSNTYKAGVMEFSPVYVKNDAKQTLETNAAKYVEYINKAGEQDVDIIVFPEDGLTSTSLPRREEMGPWTTIVPSASDNYNPCIEDGVPVSQVLRNISCAARNNNIYVVINIAEKLPCTGNTCPADNAYYYNCNVIFDRLGKIIARYRKTYLFLEPQFNVTAIPEIVTFDTDFGVRFGTFICFDILFAQPAVNLTRDEGVTDIVFPAAWFSELPFLSAVQSHIGWSYAEDVNLLASGYNNPKSGNSGSGIHLGRAGIGKAIQPLSDCEEMLVFDVPKKSSHKTSSRESFEAEGSHSDLYAKHSHQNIVSRMKRETVNELLLLHEYLDTYETVLFSENITQTVCHNRFCCDFNIVLENVDPATHYRIAVFNGRRMFVQTYPVGVKACAIVQCSGETVHSCGSPKPSNTIFKLINITGNFEDYNNMVIMPSTLGPELLPLQKFSYHKDKYVDYAHVSMHSTAPQSNIITFGIYARDFNGDH